MTLNEAQPLAKEWQRITGKSLFEMVSPIWAVTGECLPDGEKIDEWLNTPDGISTGDWLIKNYGYRAYEIIDTLLNDGLPDELPQCPTCPIRV